MDVGNTQILKHLAQMAREAGQLDQAERSLRALLLVVRRQPPGDELDAVGLAEVLFELHYIAAERGDQEKASELMESGLEAARQSDAEVARLRRVLVAHKQGDLLLRAIEARLAQAEDAASRAQLLLYAAEAEADLLERPDAAFERLLEAMKLAPGRADLHARARAAAIKAGALERYLDAATAELDRMRRKQEAPRVAKLAMELGKLAEEEAKDLERARELYRMANRMSDEPTDSLFALSRVCAALGDTEGQTRALDELAALAGDDEPSPQRADALYRLAQVQASSPEMIGRAHGAARARPAHRDAPPPGGRDPAPGGAGRSGQPAGARHLRARGARVERPGHAARLPRAPHRARRRRRRVGQGVGRAGAAHPAAGPGRGAPAQRGGGGATQARPA